MTYALGVAAADCEGSLTLADTDLIGAAPQFKVHAASFNCSICSACLLSNIASGYQITF